MLKRMLQIRSSISDCTCSSFLLTASFGYGKKQVGNEKQNQNYSSWVAYFPCPALCMCLHEFGGCIDGWTGKQ